MTAPQPQPDPQPPTSPQALAVPCARCGREDGYVPNDMNRPSRVHGFCASCYASLTEMMQLWDIDDICEANATVPYAGRRDLHTIAAENAQRRTWTRARELRDKPGPLITVALSTGRYQPIYFGPPTGRGGAVAPFEPWRAAPWHYERLEAEEAERAAAA